MQRQKPSKGCPNAPKGLPRTSRHLRGRKVNKRFNKLTRSRQQQSLTRSLLPQLISVQIATISTFLRRLRQRANSHLGSQHSQHRDEQRMLQVIKVVRTSRKGVVKGTRTARLGNVRRTKDRRIIRYSSTVSLSTKVRRHIRNPRAITAVPRTQFSSRPVIRFSTNLLRDLGVPLVTRHNKASLLTAVRTGRHRVPTTNHRRVLHNPLHAFSILHNSVIRLINGSTFASRRREVVSLRLVSVVLPGLRETMGRTISRHLLNTIRHLRLAIAQVLHQLRSRTRTSLLHLLSSRQQRLHRMQRLRIKGNRTSSTNLPSTRITYQRIRHMSRFHSNFISLITHNLQSRFMVISGIKGHFCQCTNHFNRLTRNRSVLTTSPDSLQRVCPSAPSNVRQTRSPSQPASVIALT